MGRSARFLAAIIGCLTLTAVAEAADTLPQLVIQSRDSHQRVTALAFSPDGKTLATGDSAGQIALYDANTGLIFNSFGRHSQAVRDIAVTDDRKSVISVGSVNTEIADDTYVEMTELIHWDGRNGTRRNLISGNRDLRSPSHLLLGENGGRYCLSGSESVGMGGFFAKGPTTGATFDANVDLSAMLKQKTPDSDYGSVIGISNCGSLAIIHRSDTLELWDLNRQIYIADITPPKAGLAGHEILAQFSADESLVVIFSQFGPLSVLDLTSRKWLFQTDDFQPGYQSGRSAVAVSPDGAWVAYPTRRGEGNYEAVLWNRTRNKILHHIPYSQTPIEPGATAGFVSFAFSPDGKTLATGDQSLRLWNIAGGGLRRNMTASAGVAELKATAFSSDRRAIFMAGAKNGRPLLQKLDLINGTITNFAGHSKVISAIALIEHEQRTKVASGTADGALLIHDAETGHLDGRLQLDGFEIKSIAVAPDGQHIAVAGGGMDDGRAVIVSLASGALHLDCTIRAGETTIGKAKYARDGTLLLGLTNYAQEARPGDDGSYELDPKSVIIRFSVDGCSDETHPATALAVVNFEDFSYSETSSFDESPADGSVVFATHYVDRRSTELFRWKDNTYAALTSIFADVPDNPVGRLHNHEPASAVSFARDGSLLVALGSGKGSFVLERPGQPAVRLDTGSGALSDAYFSADGNVFVTISAEGSLSFWDTKSARKLLTVFSFGTSEDFLLVTDENYYWTTQAAVLALAFRSEQDIFPFQQFDLRFNRPDKVIERVGMVTGQPQSERVALYRKAFDERLAAAGVTEDDLGGKLHLPDTPQLVTQVPGATDARSIDLVFALGESAGMIKSAVAMVNGVPLQSSLTTFAGEAAQRRLNVTVPLADGANNIRVSVIDGSGAESLASSVGITREGARQPRDLYAVLIGAASYRDQSRNLDFPAKDADDVAMVLGDTKGVFDRIHITKLLNADVTRANVQAIKAALARTTVNDTVVVYYAGHGMLSKDLRYYLATYDTDFTNPAEAALDYSALAGLLEDIPARNKLLLVDACHSGELSSETTKLAPVADAKSNASQGGHVTFRGETGRGLNPLAPSLEVQQSAFNLMKSLFTDIRRRSGATVIASAGAGEFAYEGPAWSNGVFTFVLRTALSTKEADSSGDGRIDVRELKSYLQTRVAALTEGRQQPTVRDDNPENVFVLH